MFLDLSRIYANPVIIKQKSSLPFELFDQIYPYKAENDDQNYMNAGDNLVSLHYTLYARVEKISLFLRTASLHL